MGEPPHPYPGFLPTSYRHPDKYYRPGEEPPPPPHVKHMTFSHTPSYYVGEHATLDAALARQRAMPAKEAHPDLQIEYMKPVRPDEVRGGWQRTYVSRY